MKPCLEDWGSIEGKDREEGKGDRERETETERLTKNISQDIKR